MTKYLVVALAVAVLLAATAYKSYNIGAEVEAKRWLEKEIKQAQNTIDTLNAMHDEARAKESLANVLLNGAENNLIEAQNEISNQNSIINRQYRDIERLQWELDSERTAASEARAAAIATRKCDGEKITELSKDVSRFIFNQFGRCDQIVNQLTACQEVIRIDRQICNAPLTYR